MKTQQMRWLVAGVVVFLVTAALWWRLAEARREREAIAEARRLAAMEEARRHHAEAAEVLRRLEALSTNRFLWDGTLAEFRSRITNSPAFSTNDLHKLRSPYQQIDTPPWPKTNHTAKSTFAGNDRM